MGLNEYFFASDQIKDGKNKKNWTFERLLIETAIFDFFLSNFWATLWKTSATFWKISSNLWLGRMNGICESVRTPLRAVIERPKCFLGRVEFPSRTRCSTARTAPAQLCFRQLKVLLSDHFAVKSRVEDVFTHLFRRLQRLTWGQNLSLPDAALYFSHLVHSADISGDKVWFGDWRY